MKYENIVVGSEYESIDKDVARNILKKAGITKDFEFSPCYDECICNKLFKENTFLINFHLIPSKNSLKWKRRLLSYFGFKSYHTGGFIEDGSIRIYILNCIKAYQPFHIVLKHELLHKYNNHGEHCKDKNCFFSNSSERVLDFCDDCNLRLKKILKEINKETILKRI